MTGRKQLSESIADALRGELESGRYRAGKALPSVAELRKRFGAGEVTVKDCVFYDADCYFGANLGPGRMLPACSHRDVAVCDNVFVGRSRLLVHGCTGLTISNNVFDCASDRAVELKNTTRERK